MKPFEKIRTFLHDIFDVSNDPLKKQILQKSIEDMTIPADIDNSPFQNPERQGTIKPTSMAILLAGLLTLSGCCCPWAQLPHNPDYKPPQSQGR